MPKLTNKKKLTEWLDIYFGKFNAYLGDFLIQDICQHDWGMCGH